jgi:hypothetical protein
VSSLCSSGACAACTINAWKTARGADTALDTMSHWVASLGQLRQRHVQRGLQPFEPEVRHAVAVAQHVWCTTHAAECCGRRYVASGVSILSPPRRVRRDDRT